MSQQITGNRGINPLATKNRSDWLYARTRSVGIYFTSNNTVTERRGYDSTSTAPRIQAQKSGEALGTSPLRKINSFALVYFALAATSL